MAKVHRSSDCGNSPKNQFAEAIAIAVELGDAAYLADALTADSQWERGDGSLLEGDALRQALPARAGLVSELAIDHVVTHGKAGAVNGTLRLQGGEKRRFCHVLEFANTKCDKLRRLISYGGPCDQVTAPFAARRATRD